MLDRLLEFISCAWLFRLVYGFGDAISPSGPSILHLRYRDGRSTLISGILPSWAKRQIEELLAENGVTAAVLKQARDHSFKFSKTIPEHLRQRLINLAIA